jgi:hypothetical protein
VYGAKPFAEYGEVSEEEPAAPNTSYVCQNDMSNLSGKTIRCREHSSSWHYVLQWWSARGAVNTSTPWRSDIFERWRARQPTSIDLPFARVERFPLIHVEDVAEVIQRFVHIRRPIYSIYNTPAENWKVRLDNFQIISS